MSLYFDHMASTPCHPDVIVAMNTCLQSLADSANPSSQHPYGKQCFAKVQQLEADFLKIIGAQDGQIVWTSGATEAINLALLGTSRQYRHSGRHIISLTTEHSATLETLQQLRKEGFDITLLPVRKDGLVEIESIKNAIRTDTLLCTLMHVHNEIGVIQNIPAIADLCDQHGVLLHVDCAQSLGKAPVHMYPGISMASFSAHKCYGPKGVGALYLNTSRRKKIQKIQYGGSQQNNYRAGTLPLFLITGMVSAAKISHESRDLTTKRYAAWQRKLRHQLHKTIRWNGCTNHRAAQNCHLTLPSQIDLAMLSALKDQFHLSSHSACQIQPESHVLHAIGLASEQHRFTLRIGFGLANSDHDVDALLTAINHLVEK